MRDKGSNILQGMAVGRTKLVVGFFLAVVVISTSLLLFSGGKNASNSLSRWNFSVSNSSIVIDEALQNLTGAQVFVKANLTLAQAKKLAKAFAAQPISDQIIEIYPLSGEVRWTPEKVKGTMGYFKKQEGSSLYFCVYTIGIEKPNHRVLYFYAVTFDN